MVRGLSSSEAERRSKKHTSQLGWFAQVMLLLLLLAGYAWRLGLPAWATAVACICIMGLSLYTRRRITGPLWELETREELSCEVGRSSGMRRMNLLWHEYAMARSVARGTYRQEPPSDFIDAALDASRLLGSTTHYSVRGSAWFLLGIYGLAVVLALTLSAHDPDTMRISLIVVTCIMAVVTATGALALRMKRHEPLSLLGERVEATLGLPDEQRWAQLVDIAREEIAIGPSREHS